jgi:hypothetical protein
MIESKGILESVFLSLQICISRSALLCMYLSSISPPYLSVSIYLSLLPSVFSLSARTYTRVLYDTHI